MDNIPMILILIGSVFLVMSILKTIKIKDSVPSEIKGKWVVSMGLMIFFLLGYIFAVIKFVLDLDIPIEFLTGAIFLGGGVFVYIIINLTNATIKTIEDKEVDLWLSKEKLKRKQAEQG